METFAPRFRPRRPSALCVIGLGVALAGRDGGAGAEPLVRVPQSSLETVPAAPALLALILKSESPRLDADRLAEALSRELGVVVLPRDVLGSRPTSGVLTVRWRPSRGELAVSYDEPQRGVVSRVVSAPTEPGVAAALAVALAGNLVRDEASELLLEQERRGPSPPPFLPLLATASPSLAASAAPARTQVTDVAPSRARTPVVLSFLHPLSSNADRPEVSTSLHLSLLYGRVGALTGLALGGWSNVGGPVQGVQVGLLGNAAGSVAGAQLGFLVSVTDDDLSGLQGAFALNRTGGHLRGAQVGLGFNRAAGAVDGAQIGGLNVAGGPVRGVQIGLVNIARRQVHGVQLGLVNVADDIEGLPLGLVNVSRTGTVDPLLWSSTTTAANVGVKFNTRRVYTILALALAIEHPAPSTGRGILSFVGPGLAAGARFPVWPGFNLESDVGVAYLVSASGCCLASSRPLAQQARLSDFTLDYLVVPRWRGILAFEIGRRLRPFLGVGLAIKIHREYGQTMSTDVDPELFVGMAL